MCNQRCEFREGRPQWWNVLSQPFAFHAWCQCLRQLALPWNNLVVIKSGYETASSATPGPTFRLACALEGASLVEMDAGTTGMCAKVSTYCFHFVQIAVPKLSSDGDIGVAPLPVATSAATVVDTLLSQVWRRRADCELYRQYPASPVLSNTRYNY